MRFARFIERHPTTRRVGTILAAAAMGLSGLTGCDTKGLIDPGEMGRYSHTPLTLQILSTVDPAVEEPRVEFLNAVPPAQDDLMVNARDYTVSKNDQISIEITDLNGPGQITVKTSRVSESGFVSLPLVGPIKAESLTEAELEDAIKKAYRDKGIVQNAQVSVSVVERRGAAYSILGAVNAPGQYAIFEPDFRLLDALVVARDTTNTLIEDVYIIRRTDGGRPANAPAGGGAAPKPGARDDLAPRSAAPSAGKPLASARSQSVMYLAADGNVAPTGRAPAAPAGSDPNVIYVEGKPVYVGPASAPSTTAAKPATPAAPAAPVAPSRTPAAPASVAPRSMAPTTAPATVAPAKSADLPAPAPAMTATASGSAMTSGSGKFEFNDLKAPDNMKVIRVPLNRLRNGELQFNLVIRPKDTIIVQQLPVGEYYMGGHIARPGAYSLTARKITLKQAVMAAGMLDQLAIPQRTDVIRRIGPDREVFVRVDLAKIFAGEQSDLYLKPDDQIMIGTNAIAPFLAAFRGAFRFTYGFGFLYDRNFANYQNNGQGG